jgi:hypothetical protein
VTDWREETYKQVFEQTCDFLEARIRDEGLGPGDIERMLKTARVNEGNDWLGRGSLYDATQAATVAAYEHVLAKLTGSE